MVVKTREKLLDVARMLFARKGVDNTTMNDIAEASDKGRRTVYTYFKSKREIFNAIVERESEQMVENLRRVAADPNASNADKLKRFLQVRLDLTARAVDRDGHPLRSLLSGDFRRIEKIRRMAAAKEQEIFDSIISDGVASGDFDPLQAKRLPALKSMLLAAVDTRRPEDHDPKAASLADRCAMAIDFIVAAMQPG